MAAKEPYTKLMERVRDIGRLRSVQQLLEWDQETYMPKNGVTARAEQNALIAGLAHEHLIADETKRLLESCGSLVGSAHPTGTAEPDDYVAETNLRETRRAFERQSRIPTKLVKDVAHASSLAKEAWVKSREQSAFALFAPHLTKLIELKREVADCIGYETEPYDALMDEFEPGARAAEIEALFSELSKRTVVLLQRIASSPSQPDVSILTRHYAKAQQEALSRRMAEALNFDFESGRSDVSVHPFCLTIGGCGDVRFTTRYQEEFLPAALFGTMHEVGHCLYEQGLLKEHAFTPMGEPVSLGIHESQSRMWENLVGRSRAFWSYHWPGLKDLFPEALASVSLDQFYAAINAVKPSLIRVEADEVTYNLHIVLRFEMERDLLRGALDVKNVPAAWNERMQHLLGIAPPSDREGCLQDIHWSMAIFGYFPTYALGNLYAAQFFQQAKADIPDLFDRIAQNDHQPLLNWLRTHIHRHGQRYRAQELVEHVTGKPLSIEPFMAYAEEKFSAGIRP